MKSACRFTLNPPMLVPTAMLSAILMRPMVTLPLLHLSTLRMLVCSFAA
jgi:hypothetical protein